MDNSKSSDVNKTNVNGSSSAQIALPDWDSVEVNRRLEENTKFLHEWNELLDKTVNLKPEDVPPNDLQRHVLLKRKLHENLGIMAKMVQQQLKLKKSNDGIAHSQQNSTTVTQNASAMRK